MARISAMARPTVYAGVRELDAPPDPQGRIRWPGGGPKRLADTDPGLLEALEGLVDPDTRGDPGSPLRWTTKSTRQLADVLAAQGFQASDDTVGRLLKQQRYTLQPTRKTLEGAQHPDRDGQFRYLNEQARAHLAAGQPVVSVDTKKKELVGNLAGGGAEWQPAGRPEQVNVHDFPDPKVGKAIPYGVYDLGANSGWVSVGTDHDTAAFAVATLGRWWQTMGSTLYPTATRLLVTADAGAGQAATGPGVEDRAGKVRGRDRPGGHRLPLPTRDLEVDRIEHRLFSAISMNWRGRPLESHEVIVALIGATTTRTGLRVRAELDRGRYPLGVRVGDKQLAVPVRRHQWHGEWNYSILPKAAEHDQNATLSCWAPLLPVAGLCLRVVVVMVVDDAGTGRSQAVGGVVPDPRAWDHIPACGSGDLAVSARWERAGVGLAGQILVENVGGRTCRLSDQPSVVPLGGRRSRAGGGGIRHGGCPPPPGDPCPWGAGGGAGGVGRLVRGGGVWGRAGRLVQWLGRCRGCGAPPTGLPRPRPADQPLVVVVRHPGLTVPHRRARPRGWGGRRRIAPDPLREGSHRHSC
jgi:hypothetical protein